MPLDTGDTIGIWRTIPPRPLCAAVPVKSAIAWTKGLDLPVAVSGVPTPARVPADPLYRGLGRGRGEARRLLPGAL